MNLKLVSEDSRRKLYEFGQGYNWKIGKVLKVTEQCEIGHHYHAKKDELFVVLAGKVDYILRTINHTMSGTALADEVIEVPRNYYHIFKCEPGTIIIGLATELHDDNDDLKL